MQFRRSDYDVTNTVQVSSVASVRKAVEELFQQTWPAANSERLTTAFADFERLFCGQFPGYLGCDTVYHDMQHSLDDTLAMARLLAGYERTHAPEQRLGADRALLGIIVGLFHDSGYIRQSDDTQHHNGAEFTRTHVMRGANFLSRYLPVIGLANWVPVATQVIHFTGYEVPFKDIRLDDARDRCVGHLLGTADMLAQMSDRCYLEKCRDRLYPEFVLGGVAMQREGDGGLKVQYGSGLDVLRQTPQFFEFTMRTRLDGEFGAAYRYVESLYGGRNPYLEAINRNLAYLTRVLETGNWNMLRRSPPVFTWEKNPLETVRSLVIRHIRTAVEAT
ncbi:MAG: hypothetical protein V9E93_07950 [Steroidobacteraceae bacterium]|nr:hypothetical protein [Steroidobacteraceae bacterium]MBP7013887.1 hypothetical protein [Steroidobacteraceae bacterium]